MNARLESPAARPAGLLLREWRVARRLSQADLAEAAGLSNRHLSCIETGKARPGREATLRLADALEMPLRERNALLMAAGYAPVFRETGLDQPGLSRVRKAIECILEQQNPYPAFVMDRHWNILACNAGAERVNRFVMEGRPSRHTNMIRQLFDPDDLRSAVENWEELAGEMLGHLHQLVATAPGDHTARALLNEALRYPGVPLHWQRRDPSAARSPLLTTVFRTGAKRLSFFSTITTFGTPWDVTIDELHIESCFPVDRQTEEGCAALACGGSPRWSADSEAHVDSLAT